MKTYDKYKKADEKLFLQIPETWSEHKLKHIVDSSKYYQIGDGDHGSIKPDMYLQEGEIPYIRVQNLSWSGELTFDGIVYLSKDLQEANLKSKLIPDDILVAKTGATIGKLAIIPDSIKEANTTSSVGKITVDKKRFAPRFVLYSLMSLQFKDQIWMDASQKSAQPGFNIDDLVLYKIVSPDSLPKQTAIADYLDEKTAQIDKLIAEKRRLIELLKEERLGVINQAVTRGINPHAKLKPLGIAWLGDIPEHWEVKRLKYLVSKVGSGITPSGGANVYLEEGIPLLRSQNIYNEGLVLEDVAFISEEIDEQMSNSRVKDNDVLLNITGASIGRCCYVPKGFGRGNVNQHVCIIRPIPSAIETKYLHAFLISGFGQNLVDSCQTGANREGLNFQQIKSFEIPVCDVNEQKQIVEFIETAAGKIDATIATIEKEIGFLREYRTALISEVVTGKIKVV